MSRRKRYLRQNPKVIALPLGLSNQMEKVLFWVFAFALASAFFFFGASLLRHALSGW